MDLASVSTEFLSDLLSKVKTELKKREMDELTQLVLKRNFHYDEITGLFKRINKPRIWHVKGSLTQYGYLNIRVGGKVYFAHRLAWLYVTGNWPKKYIDHINGDKTDNRIINLREATHSENMQNIKGPLRGNKSGFLGVSWSSQNKKWVAQIRCNGSLKVIGRYDSPEEAGLAYLKAKKELHPFQTLVEVNG
jgi:hypothetical protein